MPRDNPNRQTPPSRLHCTYLLLLGQRESDTHPLVYQDNRPFIPISIDRHRGALIMSTGTLVMSTTRREFLQSSLAAGAAAAIAAPAVHAQDRAKRYRTALIGTGWWGMNILGEAVASNECEVVALCDVDENQ